MKIRKLLLFALILFMPEIVFAAPNASISADASTIENGKSVTFTVTLSDTAAWNIKMTGSGAASCSSKQADVTSDGKSTTKKFSLSCAAKSEGTITFVVTGDITSGNGDTKDISLRKEITVTKAKSGVNTLTDLKVDGVTISGFSASKTSYTLADNSGKSVNITAIAADAKASISGTGTKALEYGNNSFNIVVTAENGSKKTYTINVNKPDLRSKNNNLKTLTIDQGTITFDKNTTSYLIKVEHEINEVNISATAEDSKATVGGIGKKTLSNYANEFKIVVTAENGATKTYIIKVARKDAEGNYGELSPDNSVKSITIANYDLKFNNDTKKYNILVEENVNELDFNVIPNNSNSSISIQNNTNLKPGLNKVSVIVTAENGDTNEYIFNVYKIGEEQNEEKSQIPDTSKEETSKKFNIWMIISFIELIIIIVLLTVKLKKKDNGDLDAINEPIVEVPNNPNAGSVDNLDSNVDNSNNSNQDE